jgi:hypothetical protein
MSFHSAIDRMLFPLICVMLPGLFLSGCGHSPAGPPESFAGSSALSGLTSQFDMLPDQTADQVHETGGCYLTGIDLESLLPDLRKAAEEEGFAAVFVCPDPDVPEQFLVVAQDEASAREVNGFFYWLSDHPASGHSDAPLILGLDRLSAKDRPQPASTETQTIDPSVTGVLDRSLRQILTGDYQAGILDFILSCYQDDFSYRLLNQGACLDKTWQKNFGRIEVIYHASIFSSVIFQIIAN